MKKIFLVLVFISLINLNCEKKSLLGTKTWLVGIVNNSNNTISTINLYYDKKEKKVDNINLFPDTSLQHLKPNMISIPSYNSRALTLKESYESVFNSIPSKILSIYIFKNDTLNQYTWEEIRTGYKVAKRYDVSYTELKNNNWTITYP